MSVGQVSISIYATKKQATVLSEATEYVNQAKIASWQPRQYVPTATDKQLAEAFVGGTEITSEINKERLESAQKFLEAAAWLADRPSLAEVLLERGDLTREQLGKLLGENLYASSTRGLSVNALFADTAVRLGHLSRDVALAHLKAVGADEKHLTLADILVNQGELTHRQDQQIRDALRDRIQRKARGTVGGTATGSGDQAR